MQKIQSYSYIYIAKYCWYLLVELAAWVYWARISFFICNNTPPKATLVLSFHLISSPASLIKSPLHTQYTNSYKKWGWLLQSPEAISRGVLCKKLFLEILQNSQENTCARVSILIKLQASGTPQNTFL